VLVVLVVLSLLLVPVVLVALAALLVLSGVSIKEPLIRQCRPESFPPHYSLWSCS
jgi:hypothetical protein